jgi:hypothetical protein
MNRKLVITTLGAAAALWLGLAQAVEPNPKFAGTWEVDISKWQPRPDDTGRPPKSVTITIKEAGGKWSQQVVVVDPDGKKIELPPGPPVALDGKQFPDTNDPRFDSTAIAVTDANTMVVTSSKNGKVIDKMTITLSADGNQMVSTHDTTTKDGKPYHYTNVENRQK